MYMTIKEDLLSEIINADKYRLMCNVAEPLPWTEGFRERGPKLQFQLIFAIWEYRLSTRFKRIWKADFIFSQWRAVFVASLVHPEYNPKTPEQLFQCQIFWLWMLETIFREPGMGHLTRDPQTAETMHSASAHTSTAPSPPFPPPSTFLAVLCFLRSGFYSN